MRKSRVVLIGVAVAAAAATGTAFTAGNTFTGTNIAGYGASTVTGATVTNIHYTLDSSGANVASVVFTVTEDVHTASATAVLKDGATTPNTLATSTCDASVVHTITCTVPSSPPVAVSDLKTVALTVVQ